MILEEAGSENWTHDDWLDSQSRWHTYHDKSNHRHQKRARVNTFFFGFTVTLPIYVYLYLFHCNTSDPQYTLIFIFLQQINTPSTELPPEYNQKTHPSPELKLSFSRLRELRRGVLLTRHRGSPWNHPVEHSQFRHGFSNSNESNQSRMFTQAGE